jgi:hypothetical protein
MCMQGTLQPTLAYGRISLLLFEKGIRCSLRYAYKRFEIFATRKSDKQVLYIPNRKHYVSATETNRLMLFRETVAVYCETHTDTQIHCVGSQSQSHFATDSQSVSLSVLVSSPVRGS